MAKKIIFLGYNPVMTADTQRDIQSPKIIRRICAQTLCKMMDATQAGFTKDRPLILTH